MDPVIPAIATVCAALIGGLIAYLSAVLSKESKTSEFRYTWLNAVLDDIAKFTAAAESIGATAFSIKTNEGEESAKAFLRSPELQLREALAAYYRARIRLYPNEHAKVLAALDGLQTLLVNESSVDPAKIDPLVKQIVETSHEALKGEWGRVKRGETIFVATKYVFLAIFVIAFVVGMGFAIAGWLQNHSSPARTDSPAAVTPKK
jgi:hypothetical protein